MALNVGELNVKFGADISGLNKGLSTAMQKLDRFSASINRIAMRATIALGSIGAAGGYFIKAASDAEELDNVIQQSFGNMANEINQWAKDTAKSVGRSSHQMRQFAGTTQAMLKPMVGSNDKAAEMSKTIAQLAVDMGSFWNVADKEAFTALRAGLVGETEPLRRFGIVLTEAQLEAYAFEKGIQKSIRTMNEAEKVTLRYNYILEKTAAAQGDAERTRGSFANRLKAIQGRFRDLSEELGRKLLPVATELLENVQDLVNWFSNLDNSTKSNIIRWGALTSIILGSVIAFGLLVSIITTAVKGFALLGTVISVLTSPWILGIGLIVGSLFILKTAWENNWGGIRDKTLEVWDDIKGIWDKLTNNIKVAWEWVAEKSGNAWNWLSGPAWNLISNTGWPYLKESFLAIWKWSATKVGQAWSWLSGPAWDWIHDKAWPILKNSFFVAWKWIAETSGNAWNWLSGPAWDWITRKGWPSLKKSFKVGWSWIAEKSGNAWNWLSGPAWDWVKDKAWPVLSSSFSVVWQWAVKIFGTYWDWLFNTALPWFGGVVKTAWNWDVETFDEVLDWIKNTASPWINEKITTTWEFIVKGLEKVQSIIDFINKRWPWGKNSGNLSNPNLDKYFDSYSETLEQLSGKKPFKLEPSSNQSSSFLFPLPGNYHGRIMPGKTGPDQFLAMVAPGEAIVPSYIVNRGWPATLNWFRKQGVPGFSTGKAPSIATGNPNIDSSILETSSWIDNLASSMSAIFDTLKTSLITFFQWLGDFIIGLAERFFPEQTESLRSFWDNMKSRLQGLMNSFDSVQDNVDVAKKTESDLNKTTKTTVDLLDYMNESMNKYFTNLFSDFISNTLNKIPILADSIGIYRNAVTPVNQGGLGLGVQGGMIQVVLSLLSKSEIFGTLLDNINPLLQSFADMIGMLLEPILPLINLISSVLNPVLTMFGQILSTILLPVFKLLFPVIKFFGQVTLSVAQIISEVWNTVIGIIDAIPFVNMSDWYINTAEMADAQKELSQLTWEEAMARAKNTEELNRATEALRNVPSGFKIALNRFRVAEPLTIAGTGLTQSLSDPDKSVQLKKEEVHVHLEGANIYGIDDLDRRIELSVSKAKRRRGLTNYGLSGAGAY